MDQAARGASRYNRRKQKTHLVDEVVAAHFQGLNPLQRVVRKHLAHHIQRLIVAFVVRAETAFVLRKKASGLSNEKTTTKN